MNAEQRQYWLMEIGPLKAAMMEAHGRALARRPVLWAHGKFPGLTPWKDLETAINQLTIHDQDNKLRPLCDAFLQACTDADKAWFDARHSFGSDSHPSHEEIVQKFDQRQNGRSHLVAIDKAYTELSRRLADLLA
jgi:hypothetical protein